MYEACTYEASFLFGGQLICALRAVLPLEQAKVWLDRFSDSPYVLVCSLIPLSEVGK